MFLLTDDEKTAFKQFPMRYPHIDRTIGIRAIMKTKEFRELVKEIKEQTNQGENND